MLSQLLQPEIKSLIDERKLSTLKEVLSDWPAADIAELIASSPPDRPSLADRQIPVHHQARRRRITRTEV